MSGEHLNDRLTELMEGTLSADICEEVHRHLAECADCARLRDDLQDLARLCREAAQPTTMPAELRSRLAEMLANPDPRRSSV
jgi:predicted anti-sigma-YlaC factor YlaD